MLKHAEDVLRVLKITVTPYSTKMLINYVKQLDAYPEYNLHYAIQHEKRQQSKIFAYWKKSNN